MSPNLKSTNRLDFWARKNLNKQIKNVRETLTEHFSKLKSTPQTTIYLYYHYEMITMLMLLAIKKHTAVKKKMGN